MVSRFLLTAMVAFSLALFFCVFPFVSRKKYGGLLIAVAIIIQLLDIFGYKVSYNRIKTAPLRGVFYEFTEFERIPYVRRRDLSTQRKRQQPNIE